MTEHGTHVGKLDLRIDGKHITEYWFGFKPDTVDPLSKAAPTNVTLSFNLNEPLKLGLPRVPRTPLCVKVPRNGPADKILSEALGKTQLIKGDVAEAYGGPHTVLVVQDSTAEDIDGDEYVSYELVSACDRYAHD